MMAGNVSNERGKRFSISYQYNRILFAAQREESPIQTR
jgi:hypothetical protein